MTGGSIRTALGEMAGRAPRLPMPAGIFDRARKRRRRQRILGALGAVVALAAGAALSTLLPAVPVTPARPGDVDDMPARVEAAPRWTASIEDAPLPRALVAFSERAEVILVGPHDQYRRYEASLEGPRVLSPDGRFLMTGRGLLDVTTGVTTSLGSDEPLAFSADSRLALVARYRSEDEVRGEIRAIDPVNGDFLWSIQLPQAPLPRDVSVAVAPDGSLTAIQVHASVQLYDSAGRLLWIQQQDGDLAGQKAILVERRSVAFLTPVTLCLLDTETGQGGLCHDLTQVNLPSQVVGWDQGWPILAGDGDVVSLQDPTVKLLDGPSTPAFMGFATERVRWSKREPGSPDAGPLIDRYRPILNVVGITLLVIAIVLLLAIGAIRIRMLGM